MHIIILLITRQLVAQHVTALDVRQLSHVTDRKKERRKLVFVFSIELRLSEVSHYALDTIEDRSSGLPLPACCRNGGKRLESASRIFIGKLQVRHTAGTSPKRVHLQTWATTLNGWKWLQPSHDSILWRLWLADGITRRIIWLTEAGSLMIPHTQWLIQYVCLASWVG